MDHEFSTSQLDSTQVGWDWFSLQLDSGQELMLYQLRRRDGTIEPVSGGTWIARDGRITYLPREAFEIRATGQWRSPHSGTTYPHGWSVQVPRLGLEATAVPTVDDQELVTRSTGGVIYWEGSVRVSGRLGDRPAAGRGYVELTGYTGAAPGL
jgi:predicted secreted hydrolase